MNAPFAIDARWYGDSGSGVATYAHSLLAGLMELNLNATICVITNHRNQLPEAVGQSPLFQFIDLPGNPMSIRHQRLMPQIVAGNRIKCLHTVDTHAPIYASCRSIITCHDVIPLVLPHSVAGGRKSQFKWLWRSWLAIQFRAAGHIVTVSECSQRDILRKLPSAAGRITVVPPALYQPELRSASRTGQHNELLPPPDEALILTVSRRAPYKNILGVIHAFYELLQIHSRPCRLFITGPRDSRYTEPEILARQLGVANRTTFTGYVSNAYLSQLYRRAELFVFPSLYEGFGLPVLEAMAAGVPVVSSNRSSLPEVCGDAALLADPGDSRAMAVAMARVLSDSQLADHLRSKGRSRAAYYTPGRMAERLLRLYTEVCR